MKKTDPKILDQASKLEQKYEAMYSPLYTDYLSYQDHPAEAAESSESHRLHQRCH